MNRFISITNKDTRIRTLQAAHSTSWASFGIVDPVFTHELMLLLAFKVGLMKLIQGKTRWLSLFFAVRVRSLPLHRVWPCDAMCEKKCVGVQARWAHRASSSSRQPAALRSVLQLCGERVDSTARRRRESSRSTATAASSAARALCTAAHQSASPRLKRR